jgi:hypothetical protein
MSKDDIRPPVNMKIASMIDLARMLVSWSQRERPASMLYFEHKGKHIYGTLISNHGYYEYYGLPLREMAHQRAISLHTRVDPKRL